MDDYPLTRALLTRLLGLRGQDAELPVKVLVNLHRRQLRVPLEVLPYLGTGEAGSDFANAEAVINVRWPHLTAGMIFSGSLELRQTRRTATHAPGWLKLRQQVVYDKRLKMSPGVSLLSLTLLDTGRFYQEGLRSWGPALYLYELTMGGLGLQYGLQSLELALGLDPMVSSFLLTLARMAKPSSARLTLAQARRAAFRDWFVEQWRIYPLWHRVEAAS